MDMRFALWVGSYRQYRAGVEKGQIKELTNHGLWLIFVMFFNKGIIMLKRIAGAIYGFGYVLPMMLIGKEMYLWRPRNQIDKLIDAVERNMSAEDFEFELAIFDLGSKISNPFIISRLGKDYQKTLEKVTKTFENVVEQKKGNPKILEKTLQAVNLFFGKEFYGEEKDYTFIDENIFKVQQKIIANTTDKNVLNETAYSLAKLLRDGKKVDAPEDNYSEFFLKVSNTQKELLFKGDLDIGSITRAIEVPLEDKQVAIALGKEYPDHVYATIDFLENVNLLTSPKVEQKVNENIRSLMATKSVVPLIEEDDLIRYNLFSLKEDGYKLKENLNVIEWFLEGKSDVTRKAFVDQVKEEVDLRKQYSFNAQQMKEHQINNESLQNLGEVYQKLEYVAK
jgi:hypothetical protein